MKGRDGRRFEPGENEPPGWARPALYAGSLVFRAGVWARGAAYDAGLFRSTRVSVPVVSVGNLAVGGSGKTPFTLLVAERLAALGHRVGIVSRGYGRASAGTDPIVVGRGQGAECSAQEAGDEPVMLAARGPAAVVVDADRVRGAQHAIEQLGCTVIVLDDGFQHRRLARDLDIVLLDAARPFGGGQLLPRGPLREPPKALSRADLLVLNAGMGATVPAELPSLLGLPMVGVRVEPVGVGPLEGPLDPPSALAGVPVGLLCGIARPSRFRATLEALGARVVHETVLPDHAPIGPDQLAAFEAAAVAAGAARRLTTEKDAARMGPALPEGLEVLRIELRVDRGEAPLQAALTSL